MTIGPVRAAVYLRISLDLTGEQLAVARQREDCQAIAAQRGWTVVDEYVDNSISASDKRKDRPGYNRLVGDYQAGRFDALITWDLDRLTRQPRQLEDWIDAAEERGLLLVTANGEADLSTDGGRLYARIKGGVARAESERKSARQRRAAAQRSDNGRPPLGVRLTGYTPAGETVEHEAQIVRQMFTRFQAGSSLSELHRWLNETGVPSRHGRPWERSAIRTILTNPRYAGRAIYNGQVTGKAGSWEPLVDEAVFDMIQVKLSDPRRRTSFGTARKHLGSGLYYCGTCDRLVRSKSSSPAGGASRLQYACPDRHLLRLARPIDDFVLTFIRARLGRPDVADVLAAGESEDARRAAAGIRRLRARLAVIEADYDKDLIDGRRYKVATEKVAAELAAAEAAHMRSQRSAGSLAPILAADPVAAFDAAPLGICQAVIRFFVVVRLMQTPVGRHFDSSSVHLHDARTGGRLDGDTVGQL